MTGNFRAPWGISLNPFLIVQSGRPFNITLGRDINGDTFNTERPALAPAGANCSDTLNFKCTPYGNFKLTFGPGDVMIPRNYAEGPGSTTVNLRVSKTWGFGSEGGATARNGRNRGNSTGDQQGNDGQRNSTMMGGGMAGGGRARRRRRRRTRRRWWWRRTRRRWRRLRWWRRRWFRRWR